MYSIPILWFDKKFKSIENTHNQYHFESIENTNSIEYSYPAEIYQNKKFRAHEIAKMEFFELMHSQTLNSRKI